MTDNTSKPDKAITSLALRAGTELISGIIVGVIFGLGVDYLFSTNPFGLVFMIILGAAAGFRNVFKLVNQGFPTVKSGNSANNDSDPEKKS